MPFHRAWADEQLSADFRVGEPFPGEPGNLPLLRGQVIACVDGALAHSFAGGQQLATSALSECLRSHGSEHSVRRTQLLARVHTPAFAAQPFAAEQMRPGVLSAQAGTAEPLDRLTVEMLRPLLLT